MQWTSWCRLDPGLSLNAKTLAEILNGGQAFRWNQTKDGDWLGQWSQCIARVRLDSSGILEWSYPLKLKRRVASEIPHYFALDINYPAIIDQLPHRSDEVIANALDRWEGLRLLRQPLAETLLAFLCSSTKRIAQIKVICETLANTFGEVVIDQYRALPTWAVLNELPESALRTCKMGYRARYIKETAEILAENPNYLSEIETLSFPEARRALIALPGVGEKIADCVLLFGVGRIEAFPVDVWMLRAMARHYGLEGWKPNQVTHFGSTHFGPYAGLAQQYLFAGERKNSQKVKKSKGQKGIRI